MPPVEQHYRCCLSVFIAVIRGAHNNMENFLFHFFVTLRHACLIQSLSAAFQDKLLEEMWKQQDSLEGPTTTVVGIPPSLEAGGGLEENTKDSNPLLERLRALEVKWIARSTS